MPQLSANLCNTSERTSCTRFSSTHAESEFNFQMISTFRVAVCMCARVCVCVCVCVFLHFLSPLPASRCSCFSILLTCKCVHKDFSREQISGRLSKQECVWSPDCIKALSHFISQFHDRGAASVERRGLSAADVEHMCMI